MFHIPEFVYIERQQVYLPLCIPPDMLAEVDKEAKDVGEDPLTYELTQNAGVFLAELEDKDQLRIGLTNCLFLALDACIVAFTALGFGFLFDYASAIGGSMQGS
jgi:hypothetical protein